LKLHGTFKKIFSQEQLKKLTWEVGAKYPIPLAGDHVTLIMVTPRLGYVHWHVREESVEALRTAHGKKFNASKMIVRIYDVTDILFDGLNAHMFFDADVSGLSGNYYFAIDRLGRSYLTEIGFRFGNGSFHYIARSNTVFFDRDRPSGNYQTAGLFVGVTSDKFFAVENIFDAPIYEKMNRELSKINRKEPLSVAVVFLGFDKTADPNGSLGSFIKKASRGLRKFGGRGRLFTPQSKDVHASDSKSLVSTVNTLSKKIHKQLVADHKKTPFHMIHCHDWYSSAIGLSAGKVLNIPMIFTLHSTEHERTRGSKMNRLSSTICRWEKRGIQGADLVIVPHSSTRRQIINLYDAPPEKVVIISDVLTEEPADNASNPSEVKRWFALNQDAPVVLFAGAISHAAGADLLVDALPTVCRNNSGAQFVFAGDGPLKGELEGRVWHAGVGERCRFVGDVARETFEALLMASDFVVIPARTWQDEGLAQMAIGSGRPVLTTHQAGLNCVVHGENGLITYDNPGSIIWGIQELLSNPLEGSMLRLVARKKASETPSMESVVIQHYMHYENVFRHFQGSVSS
jgi:glycosyltransferase involved in cell wall biosynthesis